jgi:hypothetical protein
MQVESTVGIEQIYQRLFRALKPRTPLPEVRVEVRRYANANAQIQLEGGRLLVKMADTLASAPEDVQEALAEILLCKLYRKPMPRLANNRYRRYLNRSQVRTTLDQIRQERGRKLLNAPEGRHYNLTELFEDLNFRYFFGLMSRPALGWSRQRSRTLLGHYDPSHNTIVLSRLLDSDAVPRIAVEYVLFHEMLHMKHPVEHRGGRRCIHTKEFRHAEQQYEHWREAKALLRALP